LLIGRGAGFGGWEHMDGWMRVKAVLRECLCQSKNVTNSAKIASFEATKFIAD
jgi:hypothetical protein